MATATSTSVAAIEENYSIKKYPSTLNCSVLCSMQPIRRHACGNNDNDDGVPLERLNAICCYVLCWFVCVCSSFLFVHEKKPHGRSLSRHANKIARSSSDHEWMEWSSSTHKTRRPKWITWQTSTELRNTIYLHFNWMFQWSNEMIMKCDFVLCTHVLSSSCAIEMKWQQKQQNNYWKNSTENYLFSMFLFVSFWFCFRSAIILCLVIKSTNSWVARKCLWFPCGAALFIVFISRFSL